ncbi:PIN domain-containing protein [Cellulophaga sp. HaHa_2_95]|uniref:PIN domain-containing protein n=1 Tax=Cellulophaga sp. HaHa_2_95 TaxID=2745558 RepID=UPI001C4F3B97|nr:PIN domain-containing protein [Cellulophaga sp. HaHa_2_95]QXP54864.1 PIN domain-containing protein [Cellulophaga sp. HaHa_2_95]
MSYSYSKASSHSIKNQENYFLDANIWLKVLAPKNRLSYKDKGYLAFFEKLLSNTKVRIIVPALVVSEVINRIIREVHYKKHLNAVEKKTPDFVLTEGYYKNVFRNTEDYRIAYNLICDDIKSYNTSIDLVNDEFGTSFKFKHVMSNPPISLDFNDYYYYNLCKKKGYFLVTDDKDFWVEDVEVVTMSDTLLNKHIATLIPKSATQ